MLRHLIGASAPHSISAQAAGPDRLLGAALAASLVLLVMGWTAPIMTVERLFFFDEEVSVLEGLYGLLMRGDIGLFAIIVVFTVIFPVIKLLLGFHLWRNRDVTAPGFDQRLRRIETLGRWSMLDVFLVSLTVAAVEVSVIAEVHLHWGLYAFAAAVILSLLAFTRMTMIAERMRRGIYT